MEKVIALITKASTENTLITGIWSNPRHKEGYEKATLKPVIIKEKQVLQFSLLKNNKEYHHNIAFNEIGDFINKECNDFKQLQLFTVAYDYAILVNKKGNATIKRKAATKKMQASTPHNRKKAYLLDNEASIPFLVALGIMSKEGAIKPTKYDKYKQINRYLEMIEAVLPALPEKKLRIIDFGCGKSYLTFAMYHYFYTLLGKEVEIIGLDLKEDVIHFCNDLANTLGYKQLNFQVGDIGRYTTNQEIDMVVSLHACNTATDAALQKAVLWKAKAILAVPCCHHEAYTQIQNPLLDPILKHGILKERIAALVTDGLRAQLLEAMGYKVTVMEFIDMEHTPKNILIRAIRKEDAVTDMAIYDSYEATAKGLHLNLTLKELLPRS